MKTLRLIPILLCIVCCKDKTVSNTNKKQTMTPVVKQDSNLNSTKKDEVSELNKNELQEIPIETTVKQPILHPIKFTNDPISCFNPNLDLNAAVDLINSEAVDTQWFIVERKEVNYMKNKLDTSDSILVKNALQKLGWKLMDSVYTSDKDQTKITIVMQKEDKVCNINKTLSLSGNKTNNQIQEWFEIRKAK
ncbi:hypothetical protein LX74_03447 [Elizabethkingia miricola]|uniref:Lipoprotein n=1 Tax=Elizabethkingia miricola TaxID=172045 RepID=A0ABY3ND26_ELIMR|nr:hypothetical protein [Elizabethkingia miricola]TYO88085.1 hypothetical protein LX74_03447 [Elizabethkingia miricola]